MQSRPISAVTRPALNTPHPLGLLRLVISRAVRQWRYRLAAEWLDELPAYLLDDVGLTRRDIDEIRRHGAPARPRVHRTMTVDTNARGS